MPKIRHLGSSRPSYPSHCRSTASTQDLYPRSLGILGFSGCVGGFFMPKIRHLDSPHPSYALRARSAGAPRLRIRIDSSLAQNPNPQRLRRRFFHAQKWLLRQLGTRHMHYVPAPPAPRPKARTQATTNVLSVTFTAQGLRARQKRSKVLFVAYAMRRKHSWRIRLAAYGARLERVLG